MDLSTRRSSLFGNGPTLHRSVRLSAKGRRCSGRPPTSAYGRTLRAKAATRSSKIIRSSLEIDSDLRLQGPFFGMHRDRKPIVAGSSRPLGKEEVKYRLDQPQIVRRQRVQILEKRLSAHSVVQSEAGEFVRELRSRGLAVVSAGNETAEGHGTNLHRIVQ